MEEVRIATVSSVCTEFAKQVQEKLSLLRTTIDSSDNTVELKVRRSNLDSVPYFVVVGQDDYKKFQKHQMIKVRNNLTKKIKEMTIQELIKEVLL